MTTSRRSGRRPEALQVADDVVGLRGGKNALERRHQRPRLALTHDRPELLDGPAPPELRVAEVPRLRRDPGRRRAVAPAVRAVAGRAADGVDALAPRARI